MSENKPSDEPKLSTTERVVKGRSSLRFPLRPPRTAVRTRACACVRVCMCVFVSAEEDLEEEEEEEGC